MKVDIKEQLQKKEAMAILNNKLSSILPDLMSSNMKLGERLRNKVKVLNFFSNIEHRNREYFKGFISSSNKRTNSLKTGLGLKRAIKQNNKNLNTLLRRMEGDILLQNTDVLLSEKRLINENTEPETHIKLYNSLNEMRQALKPSLSVGKNDNKKRIKVLTEDEMEKAKDYINNKLSKEFSTIQNNINNYKDKFNTFFHNDNSEKIEMNNKLKKDFNKFVQTLNFQKEIKLINYKKPKVRQIKDKESTSLQKINKILYVNSLKKNEMNKRIKTDIIKRNISLNFLKTTDPSINDKIKNIDVNGQDTMQILNKLAEQNDYITQRMDNKLRRVNSLIEFKLPFLNNYEPILDYFKKNKKSKAKSYNSKIDNIDNKKIVFTPISDSRNNKIIIKPVMRRRISSLKNDIQMITHKNELFYKNFYENNHMTIFNKLKEAFNNKDNKDNKENKVNNENNDNDLNEQKSNSIDNKKIVFLTEKK